MTVQRAGLLVGITFLSWPLVWHLVTGQWPGGDVLSMLSMLLLPALVVGVVLYALWSVFGPGKHA